MLIAVLSFAAAAVLPAGALAAPGGNPPAIKIVAVDGDLNCIYPSSGTLLKAVYADGQEAQGGEWAIFDEAGKVPETYPYIDTEEDPVELLAGPRTPLGTYTIVYTPADGSAPVSAVCTIRNRPGIVPGAGSPIAIEGDDAVGVTVSAAGTTVSQYRSLLNMVEVPGCSLRFLAGLGTDNEPLSEEAIVYTGSRLRLQNDASQEAASTCTIIIAGDVLGTGVLKISQLVRMAQALNGSKPLSGYLLRAGDFNGNGAIDAADLVREARLLTAA